MKRLVKILCCCVIAAALFSIAGCGYGKLDERVSYDNKKLNEFVSNYDAGTDFTDDLVIAVLTDEASARIDEYTVKDFSQIKPASLKKVGRNYLYITLSKSGREQVLRAVYLLSLRSDIEYAEPDFLLSPDV